MAWLLAILWVFLNLTDVSISWAAIQLGATEAGFLYQLAPFWPASIVKMILALVVAGLLVWLRKDKMLIALNIVMFVIVLWNCFAVKLSL